MEKTGSLAKYSSHPVDEREAGLFHMACAAVGVLHLIIGIVGIWYHSEAAVNHFRDME